MFRSILTIIRDCYEVHGKVTEVYWRYVFQYVGGMPHFVLCVMTCLRCVLLLFTCLTGVCEGDIIIIIIIIIIITALIPSQETTHWTTNNERNPSCGRNGSFPVPPHKDQTGSRVHPAPLSN